MTQEQFQNLLAKYRKGLCSPEEEGTINEWYNSIGSDADLNMTSIEEEILENKYWYNLESHIERSVSNQKPFQKQRGFYSSRNLGIAAALLLCIVSFIYLFSVLKASPSAIFASSKRTVIGNKEISNTGLKPSEILLLDGSRITLQPGSSIRFSEPFKPSVREIYLEGEAFFEVAKDPDHPFLVYTNEVTTKVLGTSFCVSAKKDEKEIVVTVKTGKVMVYAQSANKNSVLSMNVQEVILKPNQQVVYNRNSEKVLTKLVEKPEIVLQEPTFKMNYSNAPVTEILEALQESYGVDIQYNDEILSACTLTTDLSEEGLYERIEIICDAIGATYTSVDTLIVIEAKSCK